MVRIDLALVRKRTEHHDGPLSTLEEIALHQFKIRKIEFLGDECRNLRIILLENNKISKIENLGRLKNLCYLNLALNRIERVENLEKLESLRKLDLTANLIADFRDLRNLSELLFFGELYMTGNPCCSAQHYRDYVVTALGSLQRLDGVEVTKTERILALERCQEAETEIEAAVFISETPEYIANSDHSDFEENDAGTRLKRAAEETAIEAVGQPERIKREKGQTGADGQILQWNETGFVVDIAEDWKAQQLCIKIHLPVHLSTSLVELDVNESWFFVQVKEKSLQMRLEKKIDFAGVKANRITSTGVLKLYCPLSEGEHITAPIHDYEKPHPEISRRFDPPVDMTHPGSVIHEHVDDLENISDVPDDLPELI